MIIIVFIFVPGSSVCVCQSQMKTGALNRKQQTECVTPSGTAAKRNKQTKEKE
jgi:hypothetical protein